MGFGGVLEADFVTRARDSWSAMAAGYAAAPNSVVSDNRLDRAMLDTFVAAVVDGGGKVVEVGCGPGNISAYLDKQGLDVSGIDLAPGMIEQARRLHPHLGFEVGSMFALDLADGALAGLMSWYSIINTPIERLPEIFAEFHRVLAPGGVALVAFQAGTGEIKHFEEGFGVPVSLDLYRHPPERIVTLLGEAGLPVVARVVREAMSGLERTPQAALLARKG